MRERRRAGCGSFVAARGQCDGAATRMRSDVIRNRQRAQESNWTRALEKRRGYLPGEGRPFLVVFRVGGLNSGLCA